MVQDQAEIETADHLAIVRTTSLTTALEREIERLIFSGELPPGHRINEIQLANRFGTSRGPIREATRSLEAKGFVELVRNRGVFIRRLSVEEALEIYDLRAALFGLAGSLLAECADDHVVAGLRAKLGAMDAAADAGNFEEYYPLNLAFHNDIVSLAGNATLAEMYQGFVKKMHLFRARSLVQGGGLAVSNREHREIVDAIAAGNRERARAACWRHISRAKKRLLAAIRDDSGVRAAEAQ